MKKRISKIIISTVLTAAIAFSTGTAALSVSAKWYKNSSGYSYRDENGELLTGWQTIKDKKYCFRKDGYAYMGMRKLNGYYYYFDPEDKGAAAVGWQYIDGINYYFHENGKGASGFTEIDGDTYFFDPNKKGQLSVGFMNIDGGMYYFKDDGVMMKNGWYFDIGNEKSGEKKLYYVEPSGKIAVGSVTINGKQYSFDNNGVYQSGGTPYANSFMLGKAEMGMSTEQAQQSLGLTVSDTKRIQVNENTYSVSVMKTEGKFLDTRKCFYSYVFIEDKLAGVIVCCKRSVRDALRDWDAAATENYFTRTVSKEDKTEIKIYSDSRNIDPSRAFLFEYGGDAYFFITDADSAELFNSVKSNFM